MSLIKNIFAATPKRGQKLSKIGVSIAGFGASLEMMEPSLQSLIVSEDKAFWLMMAKYACYGIGTLVTLMGMSATEPGEEIKNKLKR